MSLEMIISYVFVGLGIYLLIGLVFALWFVNRGAAQMDDAAKDISLWTKLLLIPASMAFWVFLWSKWRKQNNA